MDKSLNGLIRWFCRKITLNELASIVVVRLDILSGKNNDFDLKPEIENKSANYRKFILDDLRALTATSKAAAQKLDWKQLKRDYFMEHQKELKPVKRKAGSISFSEHCNCEHCGAPGEYLYLNDGRKGNQVRCKVCRKLSRATQAGRNITVRIVVTRYSFGKKTRSSPFTNARI